MKKFKLDLAPAGSTAPCTLNYIEEPLTGKKQARFKNRVLLQPEIELNDYTCSAVVDWIRMTYLTTKPTQWKWIQREIEKATCRRLHVDGTKLFNETQYREFEVTIQEPSLKLLRVAEEAVSGRWGLDSEPEIVGLEISVDFRPKSPSDELLAKMFGVLVRSHLPSRDVIANLRDRPRFTWRTATGETRTRHVLAYDRVKPERNDELLQHSKGDAPPRTGSTFYAGERDSHCSWRIMTKVLDQQNLAAGTRLELPEDRHRVRIEVTLGREELRAIGIVSVPDLMSYRFQTFQGRFFNFRLPTFTDLDNLRGRTKLLSEHLENERRKKFLNAGVVGLNAMDEARSRQGRASRPSVRRNLGRPLAPPRRTGVGRNLTLASYDALTRKVIYALRHLGESFASSK
jgi:hypothetical protein